MTSAAGRGAATVALVALAVTAVSLLVRPGTTETGFAGTPTPDPPDDGSVVVASLRESPGVSVLGIEITGGSRTVEVWFLTAPGCAAALRSGERWPVDIPDCSGPPGVAGTVAALGVARSGKSIVGVGFEVSEACFDLLAPGTEWPPDHPECSR